MEPNSPLNDYERAWVQQGRSLRLGEPPLPWIRTGTIEAAGIFACGWDLKDNLLLLSNDGYSLTSVQHNVRLALVLDSTSLDERLTPTELKFQYPETGEIIDVFGTRAGDGIGFTHDGWILRIIYPWWPQGIVTIHNKKQGGFRKMWEKIYGIKLNWLDNWWLKAGFSPSGKYFVIFGPSGAEIFGRGDSD